MTFLELSLQGLAVPCSVTGLYKTVLTCEIPLVLLPLWAAVLLPYGQSEGLFAYRFDNNRKAIQMVKVY